MIIKILRIIGPLLVLISVSPCMIMTAEPQHSSPKSSAQPALPPLPTLKPDDTLRAAIEKSIVQKGITRSGDDPTLAHVFIKSERPPVDMAFDLTLRTNKRSWNIGPVGWSKADGSNTWYFYLDLVDGIGGAEFVLTPSATAAQRLALQTGFDKLVLTEIWSGEPIIIKELAHNKDKFEMHKRTPPKPELARIEALEQLFGESAAVLQLKRDGDLPAARGQLQEQLQKKPADAEILYNLGCLAAAECDWKSALEFFVSARRIALADATGSSASLAERAQRELRRLCGIYLHLADYQYRLEPVNIEAMFVLGQMYERSWGFHENLKQAKRWYRIAANADHPAAMCRLAAMYERKAGATVHTPQADEWYRTETRAWYEKSAALGNKEAQQWLLAQKPR